MALFIRTIGVARARTNIGLANLTYKHYAPAASRRTVEQPGLPIRESASYIRGMTWNFQTSKPTFWRGNSAS